MQTHRVVASIVAFCFWIIGLFFFAAAESGGEELALSLSSLSLGTSPPLLAQKKGGMREGKTLSSFDSPGKYVDLSYLEQAKRELGIR
jgi:hypothetical protein